MGGAGRAWHAVTLWRLQPAAENVRADVDGSRQQRRVAQATPAQQGAALRCGDNSYATGVG